MVMILERDDGKLGLGVRRLLFADCRVLVYT